MANDNVQMWKELGIDLKPHDTLLNALGPIFQEIYLSQKNRPQGMGFFDFVVGDIHGIRVKELREHAKNGGKVVATYCVFVPEEIVWAAGGIPGRPLRRGAILRAHGRVRSPPQYLRPDKILLRF